MPLVVSYLVIPLAFLLLGVNFYFRLKIIKQYKALASKNIQIEPKYFLKKKERTAFLSKRYPKHQVELEAFYKSLELLVKFVVVTFLLILLTFLFIYLNQ